MRPTGSGSVEEVTAWVDVRVVTRITPSSATGIFATYVTLDTTIADDYGTTGPLAAGDYLVSIEVLAGGATANQGSQLELEINVDSGAAIVLGPLEAIGLTGGRNIYSTPGRPVPLAAGDHTIALEFRQPGGPGTTQMLETVLRLERFR